MYDIWCVCVCVLPPCPSYTANMAVSSSNSGIQLWASCDKTNKNTDNITVYKVVTNDKWRPLTHYLHTLSRYLYICQRSLIEKPGFCSLTVHVRTCFSTELPTWIYQPILPVIILLKSSWSCCCGEATTFICLCSPVMSNDKINDSWFPKWDKDTGSPNAVSCSEVASSQESNSRHQLHAIGWCRRLITM